MFIVNIAIRVIVGMLSLSLIGCGLNKLNEISKTLAAYDQSIIDQQNQTATKEGRDQTKKSISVKVARYEREKKAGLHNTTEKQRKYAQDTCRQRITSDKNRVSLDWGVDVRTNLKNDHILVIQGYEAYENGFKVSRTANCIFYGSSFQQVTYI